MRTLIALGLVGLLATPLRAQGPCPDDLPLRSPASLDVTFVRQEFVQGNILSWPEVPPNEGACFRLEVSDEIQNAFNPQISGGYIDLYDRSMLFTVVGTGVIGDLTQDDLELSIAANHPNPAVPPLNGRINITNRGGLYRFDTQGGSAVQSNGTAPNRIPAHLPSTDVTSLTVWSDGASHRVFATITGLPLAISDDGGVSWREAALTDEDPIGFPIDNLGVSPADPDVIFAGTDKAGLWRSTDGGVTFERGDLALNPAGSGITGLAYYRVDTGSGMVDRLFVGISGIGFFYSDDAGQSFTPASLVLPPSVNVENCLDALDPSIVPRVHTIVKSPSDDGRLYLGLDTFGVYFSDDGGSSWARANEGLVLCETGGAVPKRPINALQIMVFNQQNGNDDVLLVSTEFNGVFLSTNAGQISWTGPSGGLPVDEVGLPIAVTGFAEDPNNSMGAYATLASAGLAHTSDSGVNWCLVGATGCGSDSGILTDNLGSIAQSPVDPNVLLVGTMGGGVYDPGTVVPLRRAIDRSALPEVHEDASIDVGLSIQLDAGPAQDLQEFVVSAHSYQGYAVWRATRFQEPTAANPDEPEPDWVLIGLFDRTNAEFCFEGACDEPNPQHIVECFADKRANCFEFVSGNRVEFFDREIYNGFTYQYAVSTYDYGFAGNVSPRGFDGDMVYSPRSAVETSDQSPFVAAGNNNQTEFQVNVEAPSALGEVIVVPNPLRRQGGWDTGDDSTVRFVNVSPGSVCEIFTLAGDQVARLTNQAQAGEDRGNIQWNTLNQAGESVASGVYLYRIFDSDGNELIGRFTIIR